MGRREKKGKLPGYSRARGGKRISRLREQPVDRAESASSIYTAIIAVKNFGAGSAYLKRVLQCYLKAAAGRDGFGRAPEAGGLEEPHRHAVVGAVDEVEN